MTCTAHALALPGERVQPVIQIRLDCDAKLKLEDFRKQIIQKVGEPLDRAKIAESLKKLYATGRFVELEARVDPRDTGIELVFVGRAQYFVGVVWVEGTPKGLDPRVLADASRLRLGQALSENDLVAARERLKAVLAENAYYQAQVEHELTRHADDQEVDVLFSIVAGPPARLRRADFQGRTFLSPERLAAAARWRPGDHLTSARIDHGLFKIHQYLVARGFLQATANLQKRTYDPASNTESIQARVEAGALVRVRLEGAWVSRPKLRHLLPVYKDGVADDPALERGAHILQDYFQRQGYFSAVVKAERLDDAKSGTLDITYRAALGPRGAFVGYGFEGNRTTREADLTAALAESSSGRPEKRRVFSQELLARQVDSLTTLYQSRGFLEARVAANLDDRFGRRPARMYIEFHIEEGPRTQVGHLALTGVDADTEKKLWPDLLEKPGQPYSPARAEADRDLIRDYLLDRGYTQTRVSWRASPVSPTHEVDLEYRIELSPQERIERVVVMGNEHTRAGVIRREISLRSGEPVRQSELLESQRRLYDLGIFNQVQIAMQDPQSSETQRTVLVNVEEAKRWTLGYGGGLEVQRLGSNQPQGQFKASPRLSLDLTRLNVDGRAQVFTLRGRLSNLERGGAMTYLIPRLAARPDLSMRLNALVDRSRDVLTFTAEREEASVSIEKRFASTTLLEARYAFRRVLVDSSTLRISPEAIPLLSRPARIAMLAASYARDRRDDPTDATEGSFALAEADVSWDKWGSEANFLRFTGQNATYYRLGSHFIFARNTRFALESPFGGLRAVFIPGGNQPGTTIRTHEIPLPERFFMGGSDSHRGFSINQAGPRDPTTGFPIGGNALLFNSLELRIPLQERRFGIVFFHDAGNVFSTIRKMRLLKITQNAPTDLDYTAHAVGWGVRYRTPAGPVRFDIGYDLNPPRFQTSVPGGVEVRRLSQFQFFLSIGQSF